jgi:flagellar P-ring protein precursor FlgI
MTRHPITTLLLLAALAAPVAATTIGDLARIEGERDNVLEGIGIVVGLNGTGDSAAAVNQALASYLMRRRFAVDPKDVAARNVAVVSIQARFGPYLREGQTIDVTVASALDAKSLFGGQLLQTALEGVDGEVYALAAGPVTTGGFLAEGQAAKVQQNHVVVGRIPGGGLVEKALTWKIVGARGDVRLLLEEPSWGTAVRVAGAVNDLYPGAAATVDKATVRVVLPEGWREDGQLAVILARILGISVEPVVPSRVVLNERTGTIIAGGEITLGPVSVSHGNLVVSIAEAPEVSQPAPFSPQGETKVVPRTTVQAQEGTPPVVRIPKGTSVADMAAALNAVGISPRDMIIVFQMLKRAGALHAELVVE